MPKRALDPERVLRTLNAHRVRYFLIGQLAAVLHGSGQTTFDIDITPDGSLENKRHLAAALAELNARLRTDVDEDGLEIPLDERTFGDTVTWLFTTDAGDLDVVFDPDGVAGYADLARSAETREAFGLSIPVAALDDVIRSKEAAGRPKDERVLPELRELREALAAESDSERT